MGLLPQRSLGLSADTAQLEAKRDVVVRRNPCLWMTGMYQGDASNTTSSSILESNEVHESSSNHAEDFCLTRLAPPIQSLFMIILHYLHRFLMLLLSRSYYSQLQAATIFSPLHVPTLLWYHE